MFQLRDEDVQKLLHEENKYEDNEEAGSTVAHPGESNILSARKLEQALVIEKKKKELMEMERRLNEGRKDLARNIEEYEKMMNKKPEILVTTPSLSDSYFHLEEPSWHFQLCHNGSSK